MKGFSFRERIGSGGVKLPNYLNIRDVLYEGNSVHLIFPFLKILGLKSCTNRSRPSDQ